MKNSYRMGAIAAACLALAACSSGNSSAPETQPATASESSSPETAVTGEISVFAAASLVDVLPDIEKDFAVEYPDVTITYNFGGSSGLVDQLAGGASADILLTANAKTMTSAQDQGLVTSSQSFTSNTLVLVVPADNPGNVTGLDDGSLDGKKLVICAEEVPCGSAAKQLEEVNGITLSPVSEEQSVTDVLGKVTSGEADAGLVYTTDAQSAGDAVTVIDVPGADDTVNDYRAAVLKDATNPEAAQAFVDFILSDAGQAKLSEYGFGAPIK